MGPPWGGCQVWARVQCGDICCFPTPHTGIQSPRAGVIKDGSHLALELGHLDELSVDVLRISQALGAVSVSSSGYHVLVDAERDVVQDEQVATRLNAISIPRIAGLVPGHDECLTMQKAK